jgi:hypothetical protein
MQQKDHAVPNRFAAAALAALSLAACAGPPRAPDAEATGGAAVSALPSGGCYDAPLAMSVNGAPHVLGRTGPDTFIATGPVFSALAIRLVTDRETVIFWAQPVLCAARGRSGLVLPFRQRAADRNAVMRSPSTSESRRTRERLGLMPAPPTSAEDAGVR